MKISNAILHILKNDGNPSVFSANELDIDSEVCEAFIGKHVKKLFNNPATREATFSQDSVVYQTMQDYKNGSTNFKDAARTIAEHLSEIINKHVDIPPADLMIVNFEVKHDRFFAVLKLNYKECFTHRTNDGADNQLVKYTAVLPFDGGKVEEACLIPLEPMLIRLIEKPHLVDGTPTNYFSELFLECETTPSRKETAQTINDVADEFIQGFCDNDFHLKAMVKTAMTEEAEEADGVVSMDNVATRAFSDDGIKAEFVHTMREAGIVADMPLGAKFVKQQFGTQRIKADNGVEVKFPAELAIDGEQVEITKHNDGTLTVTLKRLRV